MSDVEPADFAGIPYGCGLKIKGVYRSLKTAERKAVDYILQNPGEIKDLTIVEYAGRAGCSEATIVRLSKRLGYEGYPELKADFGVQDGDNGDSIDYVEYRGIKGTENPEAIVRKVFDATRTAISDTLNVMSMESHGKALEALLSAETVLFCGVGDAGNVAVEAFQRFIRIGKRCAAPVDPDLQLIQASQLKAGDVIVAISHSGQSRNIVNAVKRAKESGATAIAITNFPVSPLTKKSDIVLLTAVFSKYLNTEVISKRVAELCIIESLYIPYIVRVGEPAVEQLIRANDSVNVNKHS